MELVDKLVMKMSKKLFVAIAIPVLIVLNSKFDLGMTPEEIVTTIKAMAGYIFAQSVVDVVKAIKS